MLGIVHGHTGTQFKNLNIAKTTTTKTSGGVIGIILLNKHAFENTPVLISSPKAMIKCRYKSYLAEAGFHITLQFGRAAHGGREVKVAGIHTSWPHLICNQKAESDVGQCSACLLHFIQPEPQTRSIAANLWDFRLGLPTSVNLINTSQSSQRLT